MNELKVFENPTFGQVRTIEENGKVLFCLTDVAKALGYSNPRKAIKDHCRGVTKRYTPTVSGKQEMNFGPEGDVYRLIIHSKLPTAEEFEKWVFDEVLPSIRQTGRYDMTTPEQRIAAALIDATKLLEDYKERNQVLAAENSRLIVDKTVMQPKADYFDELVERNTLTNFRETAKQLMIGPKKFVGWLIEHKYIYRDKKGKLLPYEAKNNGLFEIKECINEKTQWSGTQTLITPKGRETFRLLCQGL